MVSSTAGIRHADGGGNGRSPAAAATLHCTMNTWDFLPIFFIAPKAGSMEERAPHFSAKLHTGTSVRHRTYRVCGKQASAISPALQTKAELHVACHRKPLE